MPSQSAEAGPSSRHPLSHHPHPALPRRTSAITIPSPGALVHAAQGYFDPPPSAHATRRQHASSVSGSIRHPRKGTAVSEADLLGIGASQRLVRRSGQSSTKPSPAFSQRSVMEDTDDADRNGTLQNVLYRGDSTGSRPWSVYVDSLSKEEMAVVETRFDLMTDHELGVYLTPLDRPSGLASPGTDLLTQREPPDKDPALSPTTPMPARDSRSLQSIPPTGDGRDDPSPLFPPSPPTNPTQSEILDHPLRILSRAVRELKEAIARLEEENEHLRASNAHSPVRGSKAADQVSIHDNLTEALSTSLTSDSPVRDPSNQYPVSLRSSSPTPSTTRSIRPMSPASSRSVPYPSLPHHPLQPTRSIDPPSVSGGPKPQSHRASWTAGLWVWNSGKKVRPRNGSGGSLASQHQVLAGRSVRGVIGGESAILDDEDEEGRRKGDGGSPPAFRAIFLATRIITPDPSSILISSSTPSTSLIAYLAHSLVSNARDEGIVARDSPFHRRSREHPRSRAASMGSVDQSGASMKDGKGYGDQAPVGRSLLSSVSSATIRGPKANGDSLARPSLLSRVSASRSFPTTAVSAPSSGPGVASPAEDMPLPSVELASIVPDESRPPTVLLSRQNLGNFFQSTKAGRAKLQTATRFNSAEPPLTDRYGFIYDIQHAKMLKDASVAGTPAPASLNGMIIGTAEDGWTERRRRSFHDTVSPNRPSEANALDASRRSIDSVGPAGAAQNTLTRSRTPDGTITHPHRSSTLNLNPSPARPVTAQDHLTVSARGSSSLQSTVTSATSPIESSPGASRLTVSSLLDQLTEIHDRQQTQRMAEWDAFFRRRNKTRKGQQTGLVGVSQMGLDGKAGQDDWRDFSRLVRGGIPLAYRSDVWAECSGAKDSMVPGEYGEILSVHANDTSPNLAEIEKDVSRTFPGNVFFGGDGPGVAKLRRVLIAYSWHNPAVGYCQGMNMLAATLLLTHTDEEQAYWTLLCVIERLLPTSFFSPDLLASRADQLVLGDLVEQLVPKVSKHLDELGVDLASVTFGWFLSLFTDCLPVETLFRVWDVFFVEGHNGKSLFRVAISILKLNESDILGCDSVSDLFAFVLGMTSRLWAADKLINTQHGYKPIVRHADVLRRLEGHLNALQREIDEAEE